MKTLHLLRHAKAEPPGADDTDHARPLAKRGEKAAANLAAFLARSKFRVDRIYCSTATRAQQTLAPLREILNDTPVALRDGLYMIETDALMTFLTGLPESVTSAMVVGHNPTFHQLAVRLVGKAARGEAEALRALKIKFPTGTLCSIACDVARWSALAPHSGTLTGFLRPKDLEA